MATLGEWADDITLMQMRGVLRDTTYDYGRGETAHAVLETMRARFGTTTREDRRLLGKLKREGGVTLHERAAEVS